MVRIVETTMIWRCVRITVTSNTLLVCRMLLMCWQGYHTMSRRMLSKRQCVFVVVVMPLLIVPAIIIIQHADGHIDEIFLPPPLRRVSSPARTLQRANDTAGITKTTLDFIFLTRMIRKATNTRHEFIVAWTLLQELSNFKLLLFVIISWRTW